MKVKNLKTRIAAFGLAVLMGVSTLSSANAFAAEQTDVGQEVQASEQAVTSQKEQAVTADDITKEISDETFAVETSMEGIHYDAEKEEEEEEELTGEALAEMDFEELEDVCDDKDLDN